MDRCSQLQPNSSEGKDSCRAFSGVKQKSKSRGVTKWVILSESSDTVELEGSMDEYVEDLSQDICNASDGRDHLHKLDLLEEGAMVDLEGMVDLLLNIAGLPNVPIIAVTAVKSAAYILLDIKLDRGGSSVTGTVEKSLELLVEDVAKRASDSIMVAMEAALDEFRLTSAALLASSVQIKSTATSYSETLKSTQPAPAGRVATMDATVRDREGIKSRQLLVYAFSPGQSILAGTNNAV